MSLPTYAVVMAAGRGTRMRSPWPKPLHDLAGRPMILYVLDALPSEDLAATIVVVGHGAEQVERVLSQQAPATLPVRFAQQHKLRGTGHAVMVALSSLADENLYPEGDVLILPGDAPLLRQSTIHSLLRAHQASSAALTILTAVVPDPTGYGRIVRGSNSSVEAVVEERDASPKERLICEINTAVMVAKKSLLTNALQKIDCQNDQHQYYLTDVVAVLAAAGHLVQAVTLSDPSEAQGVNDPHQLATAASVLKARTTELLTTSPSPVVAC
jgi:bifunctional UDP-N-acetylglucosamine pyrophosphorylase / glucosamine-1-phosphate N-acetyltransferase